MCECMCECGVKSTNSIHIRIFQYLLFCKVTGCCCGRCGSFFFISFFVHQRLVMKIKWGFIEYFKSYKKPNHFGFISKIETNGESLWKWPQNEWKSEKLTSNSTTRKSIYLRLSQCKRKIRKVNIKSGTTYECSCFTFYHIKLPSPLHAPLRFPAIFYFITVMQWFVWFLWWVLQSEEKHLVKVQFSLERC